MGMLIRWIAPIIVTLVSSVAQAAITMSSAVVQNGVAVVSGGGAAKGASVKWDGLTVATASKKGTFSFFAPLPSDCSGLLSDGTQQAEVIVLGCSPAISGPPAPLPRTGQARQIGFTGEDGALQKGVAWPTPRLVDNDDG